MAERNYLTIVSGLPRSGTSMMMQMIDAGGIPALTDELRAADEDNPKGYYEFEPVKQTKKDGSWVAGAVGTVVKMVHLILLDLPLDYQYRVVFMRRDLDEVVRSQDIMLQRQGKSGGDLPPEKLKGIFQMQIRKVEAHMGEHPDHFKLVEIDYNDALADPEPAVETVSTFLDGLDTDRMLAVVDPELYRNRLKNDGRLRARPA